MKIHTALSKQAYLNALKGRMESPFRLGTERCTGYFLGPVVSVTHHCQWEWNMRMIAPKNTAVGFVRKNRDGCALHCIILKGLLAPQLFLLILLLAAVIWLGITGYHGQFLEMLPLCLPVSLAAAVIVALGSALLDNTTEESQEGRKILHCILLDPTDPFSYLNHKDDVR